MESIDINERIKELSSMIMVADFFEDVPKMELPWRMVSEFICNIFPWRSSNFRCSLNLECEEFNQFDLDESLYDIKIEMSYVSVKRNGVVKIIIIHHNQTLCELKFRTNNTKQPILIDYGLSSKNYILTLSLLRVLFAVKAMTQG